MLIRRLLFMLLAVATGACGGTDRAASSPPSTADFDIWAEQFASDWVRANPQLSTRTQYLNAQEQGALDRQLSLTDGPFGPEAWAEVAARARRGLDELSRIPVESLSANQRTSAAVIRWSLEDVIARAQFATDYHVFDQFNGLQLDLVDHLTQAHPFRNRRDVENYLARLALVAARMDEGIVEARAGDAAGVVPPRFIIQRMLEQLDVFLKPPPRQNVLVATLEMRMSAAAEPIPQVDRPAFLASAEKIVADSVIPAYRRLQTLLGRQLPVATDQAGVWRLPRGDAFYAQALASFTNTRMTADEIHALGLREVARLEGEMDAILRQLGYSSGTINERYAKLEAAIQPKGSADPRPQILADAEKWVRDAERRAALIFDLRPKAPIEVRREPAFTEKTAAAHYNRPAPDGSRPGVYYLPLPGPTYELLRMRSVSYHEAVPGHHFQLALQQEMTELPRYRRLGIFAGSSAFTEGWGLYTERLADENGWYEGDPRGRLGYLNMMLFRARRLVVDTGLHAKKWTRQQAIDYGINAQEVERYIVWPGQACAYTIGQLRLVELREKARAALGPRFSIKEFHNVVLRTGSVPLEVLGQEIDRWIAASRPQ